MRHSLPALLLLLFVCFPPSRAEAAPLRGILVYHSFPGAQLQFLPFTEISWQSSAGGQITNLNGMSTSFNSDFVDRLIVVDEAYWTAFNQNSSNRMYQDEIRSKEVILPVNRPDLVAPQDSAALTEGLRQCDALLADYPSLQNQLGPIRSQLDHQLGRFQAGDRRVGGKWMSADEYAAAVAAAKGPQRADTTVVFVTKDGQRYTNFQVQSIDASGIAITFDGGNALIPLSQIPDNPIFLDDAQRAKIAALKASDAPAQMP